MGVYLVWSRKYRVNYSWKYLPIPIFIFSHTNLRSKINKTYDAFMWYILIEFDPVEIASSSSIKSSFFNFRCPYPTCTVPKLTKFPVTVLQPPWQYHFSVYIASYPSYYKLEPAPSYQDPFIGRSFSEKSNKVKNYLPRTQKD